MSTPEPDTEQITAWRNLLDSFAQLSAAWQAAEETSPDRPGPMPEPLRERLFEASPRLGTTLQVRAEMWPATPAEFDDYWKRGLEEVSIDPPVAKLLLAVADLEFLPAVLRIPLGRANRWLTTGFLPPVFREQLGLQWTERDQRRFERVTRGIGSVVLRMPRAVQQVPYNLFLRDLRRRIRAGKPLV